MEAKKERPANAYLPILLVSFAIVIALAGIWRVVDPDAAARLDEKTLMYFGVAAAVLLLREVKSFSIGDAKFEFFERKLEALETKIEDTQAAAVGGGSAAEGAAERKTAEGSFPHPTFPPQRGTAKDDPWKGVFGGQPVSGTRELSAEVTPIGTPGLYRIRLQVRSTSPARSPLRGSVQFFLHDTFRNDRPIVTVAPDGTATLALTAWGAFTVGAVADGGATKLELDLAEMDSAPADFRAR